MSAAGFEVWGVDRVEPDDGFVGEKLLTGDLLEEDFVAGALAETTPDHIVHLAAQSSVSRSLDRPIETIVSNTLPTLYILNYLRASSSARLLAVGSADEYGTVGADALPLREDQVVLPANPYAIAKSMQNQCCRGFATLYGVNVVLTRSFNHTGRGQTDTFVLPSFARQVAEIKLGRREPVIEVGNLDVKRDFLDVRDVCAAYVDILQDGRRGETYNVCSGGSYVIRDMLDTLCRLGEVDVEIRVDPKRLRPVDMPELRGDPSKLYADTGWKPNIPIEETLRWLLEGWIESLSSPARDGVS